MILIKLRADPLWFVDYMEDNKQPKGIHASEFAWAKEDFDFVIENNGTLEDLNANVDKTINDISTRNGRFTIKEIVDATNDLLQDHQ